MPRPNQSSLATIARLLLPIALITGILTNIGHAQSDQPPYTPLAIRTPVPYQVLQRTGFVPHRAHEHAPGGPARGFADVIIRIDSKNDPATKSDGGSNDKPMPSDAIPIGRMLRSSKPNHR